MQGNKCTEDAEGDPDRVDPFYNQGKLACAMFLVLFILSFLVIGIVTGLNFSKNPQRDENKSLFSDGKTPIPFQYKGPCSDGWIAYNNSCYLLVEAYETWELSKSLCHEHGAHLMVVNSEEELEYILKVVKKTTDYWIGLKRDGTGKWSWVNGDGYHLTPNFWDNGQPGRGDVESCIHLNGIETARLKLLHYADCNSKLYYICERKLRKV
nr:early activation antigen CD69 [Misgurnus anguillicaudatus]XP_055024244.1 early activation antigen CD69 [Misgurnus anguillicaudatus]